MTGVAGGTVETGRRAGQIVITLGSLVIVLAGFGAVVERLAAHGRSVKHRVIKGVPTLVVQQSTHRLWLAFYAATAAAVLLLLVAIWCHMDRRRSPRAAPPAHQQFIFMGSNESASTTAELVRMLQAPNVNASEGESGGTGV